MGRMTQKASLLAISVLLSTASRAAGVRESFEASLNLEDQAGSTHEAEIHRHAAASSRDSCEEAKCNSGGDSRSYFKGGQQKFAKFSNYKLMALKDVPHPVLDMDPKPKPPHLSLADDAVCREVCDIEVEVPGVVKKKTATFKGELVRRSHPFDDVTSTCEPHSHNLWETGDPVMDIES